MKKLITCLFILTMITPLFADEEEDLKKEYKKLQIELSASEEDYWKSKYNLIELKQNAKVELDELENEYDDLLKGRNSVKEEILALGVENSGLSETLDNYDMREAKIRFLLPANRMRLPTSINPG